MLFLKNGSYIEDHRKPQEGSLFLFHGSIEDVNKNESNLSDQQFKRLKEIYAQAITSTDLVLSLSDIELTLNLTKKTAFNFMRILINKEVFTKLDNFHYQEPSKYNLAYALKRAESTINPYEFKNGNGTALSSGERRGVSAPYKAVDETALARRYRGTVNLSENDFHVIDESKILSALMGLPNVNLRFADFVAKEGVNTKKNSKTFALSTERKGPKYNTEEKVIHYKAETRLESDTKCLETSDIQFIYTLVNLTLKYHLDHASEYSKSQQIKRIENVTPILRDDIMTWLSLNNNISRRTQTHQKMYQIQNNRFSLKYSVDHGDNLEEEAEFKTLFTVINSFSRSVAGKKVTPYKYFIRWDVNVLRELFETQMLYLYPQEVIRMPFSIFILYKWARSLDQNKNTDDLELHFNRLSLILNEPNIQDLINRLQHDFNKAFPEDTTVKRTGKTKRSKLVEIESSGSVGGMYFGLQARNLTQTKNKPIELSVFIHIDKQAVLKISQPQAIQDRYFLNGKPDHSAMAKIDRGTKGAIYFSNTLPLVSKNIASYEYIEDVNPQMLNDNAEYQRERNRENEKVINDIEYKDINPGDVSPGQNNKKIEMSVKNNDSTLKNTGEKDQEASQKIKIRTRRYSINIAFNHNSYLISKYTRASELNEFILEVSSSTNYNAANLYSRIINALDKVGLFEGKRGVTLSPEAFHRCMQGINKPTSQIIRNMQLRAKGLQLIDIDNEKEVRGFIVNLANLD